MNLPNKITISRILMIPVFAAIFFIEAIPYNYLISAFIFLIAASTDAIDGHIARKYQLVTNMGKFLDPIADKVLVSTAYILMLTNQAIMPSLFGGICVAVIIARELIVSGFRMVAASTGLVLAADKVGKIKTVFQDFSIFVLLCSVDFFSLENVSEILNISGIVLLVIATFLTIWSGLSYVIKNRQIFKETK